MKRWWRTRTPRERRDIVVVSVILVPVVAVSLVIGAIGLSRLPALLDPPTQEAAQPVPSRQTLYSDPALQAAAAARTDPRFDVLARTPQAKWFTDWSTVDTAFDDVSRYVSAARGMDAVPVVVLYRIPGRDCGAWAAGGAADDAEYRAWIDEVARALGAVGDGDTLVVVEPDALPQIDKCPQGDRTALLRDAVERIAASGVRVYVDAGHSNWVPVEEMAERLLRVGVADAQGFSLNVSNFQRTDDEIAYATQLRATLRDAGVPDAHYIIDTGRNGAGPQGDERCNPPGARLGAEPELFEGTALDGYLWIKNPGETDGACRGGPSAGFWAPAALSLLGL